MRTIVIDGPNVQAESMADFQQGVLEFARPYIGRVQDLIGSRVGFQTLNTVRTGIVISDAVLHSYARRSEPMVKIRDGDDEWVTFQDGIYPLYTSRGVRSTSLGDRSNRRSTDE